MDDFDLAAHRTVASLDVVPEFWRECYEPSGDGFRLMREFAEAEDAHQRKLAELDAKIARMSAKIAELSKRKAVREALEGAGVSRVKVATEFLLANLDIRLNEEGEAAVTTPFGDVSVESAVADWLATDDAREFRPKPEPTRDGRFAAMVKAMSDSPTVH